MTTITILNGNDSGLESLRDAIIFANSNPNTTINFDPLVTVVTLTSSTLSVLNAVNLIIDGTSINPTITRSSGDFSIFTLNTSSVSFDTISVTAGTQSGIISNFCTLLLNNVNITNNNNVLSGSDRGGGIDDHDSTITITNSNISNNTASLGGAIEKIRGALFIDHCTFSNNRNAVMRVYENTACDIHNSAFYNNSRGIATIEISNALNTPITLINNTITNNASSNSGGLLFTYGSIQRITISNCTISHNSYSGNGTGGIYRQ